ncbi:MAG: ribonuclease III [Sphingomonadaceae bacterium]|nr:ribonuclease III [Sphingomonadaceae bacterium]
MNEEKLAGWIAEALGHTPSDVALFERALTHPSMGEKTNYQRLEFLGDRVLGLAIATWLYKRHREDPEGKLNSRLSELVSRMTCAAIGREIGVAPHIRLGKQARDDGAADSDNVLGDVVEALIGALYLDGGIGASRDFISAAWESRVEAMGRAPTHPKSALQEWAAANGHEPPIYRVATQSGPQHSPQFIVRVEIPDGESAEAEGTSKQDAETAAARALLEKLA